MFEDSLVISQVQSTSHAARWTALASTSLQFAFAALVIALPLLHPDKLAFMAETPHVLMPPSPKRLASVERMQSSSTSTSMTTPVAAHLFTQPPMLPGFLPQPVGDAPPTDAIPFGRGMADATPIGVAIGDATQAPRISIAPTHPSNGPIRVSSGVSAGRLIAPIRPVYPEIARAARVEGTVVVEAIISRTGIIESLHVVSGPPMLQRAAIDAIHAARYQPFQLNGSPTEVQTTISVGFHMGT
jgi:periplasmic protein TonB